MVGGVSFKSMLVDKNAVWVRVRELNYLIEKGIIDVDMDALAAYTESNDPKYCEIMQKNSEEENLKDMLGRELTPTDRYIMTIAKETIGLGT